MSKALDFAIIGGGLAGSLLFAALKRKNPRLQMGLFEKADQLCGNHTWCFHDSDIPKDARPWLPEFISQSWAEQEVLFPAYSRILRTPYHCIKSHDLAEKVMALAPNQIHLGHEFTEATETKDGRYQLHFRNGESFVTHSFILARGWPSQQDARHIGWQKFVGLEVELESPHGLERVLLKDVRQPQIDGYRFFYVLPLTPSRLLIEDTYYSNHKNLKDERIEKEIRAYAERQGWKIVSVHRKESGALPLYLQLPKMQSGPVPSLGAESDFVHPVTGYTSPMSLRLIQDILDRSNLTMASLKKCISQRMEKERSGHYYLSLLNRMLFLAAKNENRYKVLERFYRLPEPLIDRFYSGKLTLADRARILIGKPPVPVADAIRALRMK